MKKHKYITTAIPYVNAKPHIGNAIDYLLADVWTRYQIQSGHEVKFQAGTDEHGNKIAKKAAEENLTPQDYVDKHFIKFKELINLIGAKNTDFIRTTDTRHKAVAQYIWQKLKPHIYKSNYEGWYCQGCENFVTDQEASDNHGLCPDHKTSYERVKEENYFLKISDFSDRIRHAIETNEMKILPESRKKEFLNLIKDGFNDVSISRPVKSVSWGIPVPEDDSQVMYVWLDALSNYITILGYPEQPDWNKYWPADVQVIGKDILRFHAGIWPAILLGLNLPLPKLLLVHGHVNIDGTKMSKTIGNVVDPIKLVEQYGSDAFRYYFTRYIPTQDDGDFNYERFEDSYNNDLGNDFGNLVSRIASMIDKYQSGVISQINNNRFDESSFKKAMDEFRFDRAIEEIWQEIRNLNKYIDTVKPWEIAKDESNPDSKQHLAEVLRHMVGAVLQIANMLDPFLPITAQKIKETFPKEGAVDKKHLPLFPKIYIYTPNPRANND